MRILVTKQGNIIIQEIDDALPIFTTKFRGYSTNYNIRNPQKLERYTNSNKFSKTNNILRQNTNDSNYFQSNRSKNISQRKINNKKKYKNLEDSEITKEELQSAKQIKLNEQKISFPKPNCPK